MNYKIQITKCEPNPNFEQEKKDMNEWDLEQMKTSAYFNREIRPQPPIPTVEIVRDVLTCELTEEQYKTIKGEVIKVF